MAADRQSRQPGGRSPFAYLGIGFELLVPILVGVFGGRFLDRWLDTDPWLTLAGAVLGIAAGFLNFFRSVLPSDRRGGTNEDGD